MTITEAMATLRTAWPTRSFSIELDVWSHYHEDDGKRAETLKWSVYDAEERIHYEGPTLETALAVALASERPPAFTSAETSLDGVL